MKVWPQADIEDIRSNSVVKINVQIVVALRYVSVKTSPLLLKQLCHDTLALGYRRQTDRRHLTTLAELCNEILTFG